MKILESVYNFTIIIFMIFMAAETYRPRLWKKINSKYFVIYITLIILNTFLYFLWHICVIINKIPMKVYYEGVYLIFLVYNFSVLADIFKMKKK